jgi:hypothetical protein
MFGLEKRKEARGAAKKQKSRQNSPRKLKWRTFKIVQVRMQKTLTASKMLKTSKT